jgi:hypothetical protein
VVNLGELLLEQVGLLIAEGQAGDSFQINLKLLYEHLPS